MCVCAYFGEGMKTEGEKVSLWVRITFDTCEVLVKLMLMSYSCCFSYIKALKCGTKCNLKGKFNVFYGFRFQGMSKLKVGDICFKIERFVHDCRSTSRLSTKMAS